MIQLKFFRDEEFLFAFKTESHFFRIGRAAECEVSLNDESISKIHCYFRFQDGNWRVEDVSANGIRIGNEFTVSHFRLEPNKRYELGRQFSFEWPSEKKAKEEKTLILSRRPTQVILSSNSPDHIILGEARIKAIRGCEENIVRRIGSEGLSLGRHPSNDIQISAESVSQFHARIELRNNQFYLIDLGSTNGSFVDGKRVLRASLPDRSRIKLADSEWEFEIIRKEQKLTDRKANEFFGMVSKSRKMKQIFSLAEAVAATDAPVHIHGETGTGKELLARAIHDLSPRSDSAFIALNCASLPRDLLESELFGHVKGAFTGAIDNRKGAFEIAHSGTLFLDEIGELDLKLQAKLLRVLETGEVKKLGSNDVFRTSVRIISATHRNLSKLVREGSFREDLYFRLHVVPLKLPALRERLEDLDLLIPSLLTQLGVRAEVSPNAIRFLSNQNFPGNIRQLKNVLLRALVEFKVQNPLHSSEEKILFDIEHFDFLTHAHVVDIQDPKNQEEREKLLEVLRQNDFNQSKAARELKLPISTLHDRIRRLSIEIPSRRRRII